MPRTAPRTRARTERGAAGSTEAAATARQACVDRADVRRPPREDPRTVPPPSLHSALARTCHLAIQPADAKRAGGWTRPRDIDGELQEGSGGSRPPRGTAVDGGAGCAVGDG